MTNSKIQNGVVVSVAYTLTVDGDIIEEATANEPFEYLHGAQNIVPGLESALTGKAVGDKFDITIQPADGYGEYDEENIDEVLKADIPEAGELEEGMFVLLEDEDGDYFEALVAEIKADTIILDFNDQLAGKVLDYSVEVVGLRAATEEELEQGFPESYYDEDEHDHE